jgi:hypothetical protein
MTVYDRHHPEMNPEENGKVQQDVVSNRVKFSQSAHDLPRLRKYGVATQSTTTGSFTLNAVTPTTQRTSAVKPPSTDHYDRYVPVSKLTGAAFVRVDGRKDFEDPARRGSSLRLTEGPSTGQDSAGRSQSSPGPGSGRQSAAAEEDMTVEIERVIASVDSLHVPATTIMTSRQKRLRPHTGPTARRVFEDLF